ncbi:hypothetical protein AAVH_31696, partial [Aphelenchoides avenae]
MMPMLSLKPSDSQRRLSRQSMLTPSPCEHDHLICSEEPSTASSCMSRSISSPDMHYTNAHHDEHGCLSPSNARAHSRQELCSSTESIAMHKNVNWPPHRLKAPEVWINGCLVSGDNNNCSEESSRQRRLSATSTESDAKRNLPLLQNVGRTLQRTHSQLRRTRLLHVFYLCALPAYTLLGALVFQ